MMRKEQIFTKKWRYRYHDGYRQEKILIYVSLSLQKLHVEYRIYSKDGKYEVRCKYKQEKPYRLGIYHSLREAQFCVYATLMQYIIYKDGQYYIQENKKTNV